jgi:hypothetical protein
LVSARLLPGPPRYPATHRTTKTDPGTTGRRGRGGVGGQGGDRLRPRPHDAEVFYLGLALDPAYVEGFVEGYPERIGEDDPDEKYFLRGIWEEGDDRWFVSEVLEGGVDVRAGRP